jgi:hypothetical protein
MVSSNGPIYTGTSYVMRLLQGQREGTIQVLQLRRSQSHGTPLYDAKEEGGGKSTGPVESCASIGPYPKRQGGGDYVGKRGPVNITCLYVMNNDIEDLLQFQTTVHLRRETTTANALADMGGSDNFIA